MKLYSIHECPRTLYRTWEDAAKRVLKIVNSWSADNSGDWLHIDVESKKITKVGEEFDLLHIVEHDLQEDATTDEDENYKL